MRHLTDSIDLNGRQLLHLASLLGRSVEEPNENLSLLQLDRLLRERLQQLQAEKEKITAEMQLLRVRGCYGWGGGRLVGGGGGSVDGMLVRRKSHGN